MCHSDKWSNCTKFQQYKMIQQEAYYVRDTAVGVEDEVEISPATLNTEPVSQLNHTNLFVKNNLNEAEEITDIASTSVSAEKRKHDEENSKEGFPPKKRVSRSRSRSPLSSNDIEELEFEDGKKEETDVKLNQKCQVSIRPLWPRWNLDPVFILNEVNRVMRIRLAELKSEFGHLNRKITKCNREHLMEMEIAKEREISLTEQVNTFSKQ